MKKKVLRVFLSLMACLTGLITMAAFSYAADAMSEEKDALAVGNLIIQRTEAMNGYFAGQLEYVHASEQLRDIEMGDLLVEDIESLQAFHQTDIEEVLAFEIMEVLFTERKEDGLAARVTVEWMVQGTGGSDSFISTYTVRCETIGNTLKLVEFF